MSQTSRRIPGGLSEIRAIRAGCRIESKIRNLEDAIFQGYLTRQEVDLLQTAEKAFCRYLTLLRATSGRAGSTLLFDDQETLARKLGYAEKSGFLPVEIFMQHVHQLFQGVAEVSREFWERLDEGRSTGAELTETIIEEGMVARSGKDLHPDRPLPGNAGAPGSSLCGVRPARSWAGKRYKAVDISQ